jgi:hypothetical protein
VLVTILLAAFALLRPSVAHPPAADRSASTTTPSVAASPTATLADALTPTPESTSSTGGGGPVHTPTGADPFQVTSLEMLTDGSGTGRADAVYDAPCFAAPRHYVVHAHPSVPRNATGGAITYRWHVNGAVTTSGTLQYRWDAAPGGNDLTYPIDVDAATADGSTTTVQVEIVSPNALLSPPAHISVRCQLYVNGGYGIGNLVYLCPGNTTRTSQDFRAATHIPVTPSPGGQVTYHWELPDGSNSPDQTVSIAPGATQSADVVSWTVTLTPDSPDGTYRLSLITTAPNSDRLTLDYITKACAGAVTPTLTLG